MDYLSALACGAAKDTAALRATVAAAASGTGDPLLSYALRTREKNARPLKRSARRCVCVSECECVCVRVCKYRESRGERAAKGALLFFSVSLSLFSLSLHLSLSSSSSLYVSLYLSISLT